MVDEKNPLFFLPPRLNKKAEEIAGSIILSNSPGKVIKKFREKVGITQKELSDLIDVARETISRVENDKLKPNYKFIKKFINIIILSKAIREYYAKNESKKQNLDLTHLRVFSNNLDLTKSEFEDIAFSSVENYENRKKKFLEDLEAKNGYSNLDR
ncbi:MAG: putative transcriptional regulator [Candidatus Methanohalarchaeum thermophilum]|uniref:Transcriptional regulator n=1 Tax=Methanohalarchaeum thermophilum TaxID=1903181 RepID=A0A1Q6DXX1_METT1|nr:MAG: putative transcriptional regulator [Candidatus Methanohalarchaeum thermophilum]